MVCGKKFIWIYCSWGNQITVRFQLNPDALKAEWGMGMLSKLFGSTKSQGNGAHEHAIIIHFTYGSTNLQHVYALEDEMMRAISDAGAGEYDGHEVAQDGSDGFFYMYGPDAEALYRVISPLLAEYPFMRGAKVTLRFGPRRPWTPKRVFHLAD